MESLGVQNDIGEKALIVAKGNAGSAGCGVPVGRRDALDQHRPALAGSGVHLHLGGDAIRLMRLINGSSTEISTARMQITVTSSTSVNA